jgi:hypothetical protein
MKTSQVTLIIIGFILLAMMATNPSIEDHREGVKEMYKKKLGEINNEEKDNVGTQIGIGLASIVGDGIINKMVSRENYILFSMTKVSLGHKSKLIGLGVFGKVFLKDYQTIEENMSNSKINEEDFLTRDEKAFFYVICGSIIYLLGLMILFFYKKKLPV